MTILVLGATGKTGRRLHRALHEAGEPVRAASRQSPTRFDWSIPDTWAGALSGASALYLVAPDDPTPIKAFVDQAAESGVRRFVVLSGRGLDTPAGAIFPGMAEAERAVRDLGVEWTVLRPNNFNQNFNEDLFHGPLLAGRLALPAGAVPEPFIDAQDIADVAATVLTNGGHHGKTYDLSGPEALTFAEAVDIIAQAAGRPIKYEELTPTEYANELHAAGVPTEVVSILNGLFAYLQTGQSAPPTTHVEDLLGRPARRFTDYATKAAEAWS
ncbi:NmrA family NAD(P)-binding protein [Actinokineospora diospyrosa]|uniref:Uncharacterized conserved protein YbjT, contains NAD(P)-binding and DUF2867 domains n=1 Tax=Actinokineospora diospyrosa TaxID=103728 RepID=A0ABT1I878_9PSEU|nr:NAD(P)H-binding protein [Actinokineospora diospyrosa]MCP2268844.1 Uncharacterized conserved protein YbjT, contains NAD(P)-binding and DUF2867 domains [Actinokineospora diospyrosa]